MGEFEDPKKTDDQIAKQLAADLATEFEVYKKVKEQLEEKGATAKEIKESTGQNDIRGQLDRAKNEDPKKADNKIVEEVVAKIVSVFQVYKKVKEQLKEKGATTE